MGCISWVDGCNIIGLTPLRETTPMPIEVVSQERRQQAHLAALTSSYITHQPGGSRWVAAVDIDDRASLPDLEKPVLWWKHREGETKPRRG